MTETEFSVALPDHFRHNSAGDNFIFGIGNDHLQFRFVLLSLFKQFLLFLIAEEVTEAYMSGSDIVCQNIGTRQKNFRSVQTDSTHDISRTDSAKAVCQQIRIPELSEYLRHLRRKTKGIDHGTLCNINAEIVLYEASADLHVAHK